MNKEQFYNAVKEKVGIELSELQRKQYSKYYDLVVEWNQRNVLYKTHLLQ